MPEVSSEDKFDGIEEDQEQENHSSLRVLSNESPMYNTVDLAT